MKNFNHRSCRKIMASIKTRIIFNTPIVFICLLLAVFQSCKTTRNEIAPHQQYVLGYVRTTAEEYSKIPKAPLIAAGSLPTAFQLDAPPIAFNQGEIGSCASCATSGGLSIMYHTAFSTPYPAGGIIFSPSYLYNQVHVVPSDCNSGSNGPLNFNIVISQGDPLSKDFAYDPTSCSTLPNASQRNLASAYKISQYMTIDPISISALKQYIYSGLPVIVVFQVDDNFIGANSTSIWSSFGQISRGWHCTLLYGWDDSKNAFKMLNSWGSNWGDHGSTWVDYDFLQNGSSPEWGKIFAEAYIMEFAQLTNTMPIAAFDVNNINTSIGQNQSVAFFDRSQNNPTSWAWTFQGGSPSTSNLQNPSVSYPNAGSFSVTLTASNSSGSNTKTVGNYINVNSVAKQPVAQFSISGGAAISAGASISFVNQSENNPTSYDWSFPGGTPSSSKLQNPTIIYSTPGIYSVTLTASNQAGSNTRTMNSFISVTGLQAWSCGQPFTDPRDGQIYNTVNINGICWLAENLRFTNNNQVGVIYGSSSSNYNSYGCLYSINEVMSGSLAPPGWHIPSESEVVALSQFILTNYGNNGGALKATSSLWAPPNLGATNEAGFSALPSGELYNGNFNDIGNSFFMWTSTVQGNGGDAVSLLNNSSGFGLGYYNGNYHFSLRCVKD